MESEEPKLPAVRFIAWLGVTGESRNKTRCSFECGLPIHRFATRDLQVFSRECVWRPILSNITDG